MIDELDRCRPSYAIELLEVAKHLFSVDRVVFVLAVNRVELAHSVKALYGAEFDAAGYLERFFDLEYLLPAPDRKQFVLQVLNDRRLNQLFQQGSGSLQIVPNVIAHFLACSKLELRRIEQAIHRLSLVCGSLDSNSSAFAAAASILLVCQEIKPDVYSAVVSGTIDDLEAIEQFYHDENFGMLQFSREGCFFEAIICQVWFELARKNGVPPNDWNASKLYKSHNSTIERINEYVARAQNAGERGNVSEDDERLFRRATEVQNACYALQSYVEEMRLDSAIRRIELLPSR